MALATIYQGSPELLQTLSVDVTVANVAEYVDAYDEIVRALHAGREITVAVSHLTVGSWLRRLEERYGAKRVQTIKLSLRGRLSELWNIEVPDWVTEDQIDRAQLLDVRISAQPGRDFEDFLLEVFFGPYLAQRQLPLRYLSDIVESYDPQQWSEAAARPLVGDVLRRRLQQWQESAQKPGEHLIIEWLERSPEALTQKLARLRALEGYPPGIGRRILGDQFDELMELDLDLSAIPIGEWQIGQTTDQIRVHLHQLSQSGTAPEALEAMLAQVSGSLLVEFEAVHRLLRSGQITIGADLVRRVRGLFAPIQDRPQVDQALADLDLLISQPVPPTPDPDPNAPWTDEQWLDWATTRYLPYRFWLEEIGQLGGDIVELATAYGDWLYARYPSMRLNSSRMIYQALPALRERLMGDAPVLVLVVDNFNAKFFRDLTRYMREEGFYAESLKYYVSMLPSCTEVSKKSLFVGEPEPFSGTAYQKIVEDTWNQALGNRRVCYLPHIGALRSIRDREHDVYILNYLPIDMSLHQDEEQVGITHAQSVRSYLRAVSRDVRAFGECINASHDLAVVVVSDHGSTRIPSEAPNLIDADFYARRVQDKHHRYVRISDNELQQLPPNIDYQCYTFERKRFGLDGNYLAARRHYRFLPTSESTYIHGGLTPEETLVPVAVFTPLTVSPKPLVVDLLGKEFYYGRRSEIQIELVNTNSYACELVRVEILNPNVDATGKELGTLEPLSQAKISLEIRFRRSRDGITALHIRITYNFLDQPQQQDIEIPIEMKSIMEQTFDLDDLMG